MSIYGVRAWRALQEPVELRSMRGFHGRRVVADPGPGKAYLMRQPLESIDQPYLWPTGVVEAECQCIRDHGGAAGPGSECGLYAWHKKGMGKDSTSTRYFLKHRRHTDPPVDLNGTEVSYLLAYDVGWDYPGRRNYVAVGIVEAWGRVQYHAWGFRSQYMRPVAVALLENGRGYDGYPLDELATRYHCATTWVPVGSTHRKDMLSELHNLIPTEGSINWDALVSTFEKWKSPPPSQWSSPTSR